MLLPYRLLAAAVTACLASAALGQPLDASRGRWTGTVAERSQGAPASGRVELRVEGTADRFTVELTQGSDEVLSGEFASGQRKDVFGPPAARGLMSFLGRGSAVNPLDGKPLAWARRTDKELVVYRLDLRNGVHRLDRMVLTPAGNRMRVAFERREHDRVPERFTVTLERGAK